MKEKHDVEGYFKNKGYKVTAQPMLPGDPSFIVEKNDIKQTVDVIDYIEMSKSINEKVYNRIMSGGFFVIVPPYRRFDSHELTAYTKDDIENTAKRYHIWWKDKVK